VFLFKTSPEKKINRSIHKYGKTDKQNLKKISNFYNKVATLSQKSLLKFYIYFQNAVNV